jgi:thiol:disulfide interchange protein DsbD
MHRFLALALTVAALAIPTAAQGGSSRVVGVEASGPSAAVRPGRTFQATITLNVQNGYHINAQKPSEDYLIGTSVKLAPPEGISVVRVSYPRARFAKFSFSDTPLAVYAGTVRIVATLRAAASLAPGQHTLNGKATFQACNDQACLPPSTVDLSFAVDVGQ